MPGIEEVARRAGVSVSSVSRALRDVPGVSTSTRERVRSIATEMGFVTSVSGSRLATGRTGTIAVIVPTVAKWFFGELIAGAGAVIRAAGRDLLLFELGDSEGRERFFADQRMRGRADGVLVLSLNLSAAETLMLRKLDVPVVVLGDTIDGFDCVRVDDFAAAVSAVQHLTNLGHEHIGYIGIDDQADVTAGSRVLAERVRGFEAAIRDAGLPELSALRQLGENSTEGGREAMARLLSAPVLPTAVFVGSDEMAFGAMDLLNSAGLSVPEDVSVVGFDNHELSGVMHLSTVDQGVGTQGETAAKALLEALENPGLGTTDIVLPTHLVLRGSTAPARPLRRRAPTKNI
ncbi:MAG TPA: LacI family DNA-binding transcriptional regulator [Arthrobacter sp.]